MPIPLLILLYSVIKVVAKLATGVATATLVYYFLICDNPLNLRITFLYS